MKPSNILIDINRRAYICDFGEALKLESRNPEEEVCVTGTIPFMAPELRIAMDENRNLRIRDLPSCDIFSLGTLILYCLTPQEFPRFTLFNTRRAILWRHLETMYRNEIVPDRYQEILRNMLSFNPEDRPDIIEIYRNFVGVIIFEVLSYIIFLM